MKTIALAFNLPGLSTGDWLTAEFGKKYPGAGWMRHLRDIATVNGMDVSDAYSCLIHNTNPQNIILVQEETNAHGMQLASMGADKRVITCLESPIFTPEFYDQAP